MDNMTPFDRSAKAELPLSVLDTARKFLRYGLIDILFIYDDLTATEKSFCTKEEFNRMVSALRLR